MWPSKWGEGFTVAVAWHVSPDGSQIKPKLSVFRKTLVPPGVKWPWEIRNVTIVVCSSATIKDPRWLAGLGTGLFGARTVRFGSRGRGLKDYAHDDNKMKIH